MFGFVKMAALSAVLSYGVVSVYEPAPAIGGTSGKLYHDRVLPGDQVSVDVQVSADAAVQTTGSIQPAVVTVSAQPVSVAVATKGDRLPKAPQGCAAQTWPYLSADCVTRGEGSSQPKRVRVITLESRTGANTSVLTRTPQTDFAQR